MLKNFRLISAFIISLLCSGSVLAAVGVGSNSAPTCIGRMPNPITDVCWWCFFPVSIGPVRLYNGQFDVGDPAPTVCWCPAPPPVFIRYGVGVTYWEPARVAEAVRTPMCSPFLGGMQMGNPGMIPRGNNEESHGDQGQAFYHMHWFTYPLLSWVMESVTSSLCMTNDSFDIAYLTEYDPLWDSDSASFILNPEAVLFTNPVAQAACVADSAAAAITGFGLDPLFWCSGSAGSVFPLSGSHSNHVGGIDSSLATAHKMVYKLHRQLIALDTGSIGALCGAFPSPIPRKTNYKQNMMTPIPNTFRCFGFGTPSAIWGAGREFPVTGEDFTYLIWRRRLCCAL